MLSQSLTNVLKHRQKEQSAAEIADCKERHRLSQARYRERHRSLLNIRSLEYRCVHQNSIRMFILI